MVKQPEELLILCLRMTKKINNLNKGRSMKIKKMILEVILSLFNFIVLLFPIEKDKITFVSLEGTQLKDDLKMIYKELQEEYKCTQVLYYFKKNDLVNSLGYMLNTLKQIWHINRSTLVLINDNNFVISKFKRPGVKVIQVWHANGAIKKFGNCLERKYEIRNYDYILANSDFWKIPYAEAFGVNENQVLVTGLPKLDLLQDHDKLEEDREKFLKEYPQTEGKKILLYAPTFRGNIYEGIRLPELDIDKLVEDLGPEYVLIYKLHPLLEGDNLSQKINVINGTNKELYELFAISDMLISDYSSIIFDYTILDKPIILYAKDLGEYSKKVGCFMEYTTLPGTVCTNKDEIIKGIIQEKRVKTNKPYIKYNDGNNLKRVIEEIRNILK